MTRINYKNARNGKIFLGMALIIMGSIFFLERMGLYFPDWVISWPMFLIAFGAYKGYGQQFRKPWPIILIIVGSLFLLDDIFPRLDFSGLFWPVIFIAIGAFLILGRNKSSWKDQWREQWKSEKDPFEWNKTAPDNDPHHDPYARPSFSKETGDAFSAFGDVETSSSTEDYIDSVSVFGHVKKNIVSKAFKGGEIVNFMGGAEINLIQADFTGRIVLDVTQVFGGTKIIVPPHWQVNSEMAAIFGGTEDKRPLHPNTDSTKILVIKGTSVFGGIDIRSY